MFNYYTAIDIIAALVLVIMAFLVYENSRFDKKTKIKFYLTYTVILIAMFAEWAGLIMNGRPVSTVGIHKIIKCLDYIMTPISGYLVVNQISEQDKIKKILKSIVVLNTLLQTISIFTGWTFYIDSDNVYQHGPAYLLYILIYMIVLVGVLLEFYLYGKNYKRQNRISLFAIIVLIVIGIILQQVWDYRIACLTLTFAAVLLFIHYSEFSQLASDEDLKYQKKLLETDTLTGLFSRHAYTDALKELSYEGKIPENLVIFSIDINELKMVNDNFGHLAGDELIKGAAECIKKILGQYGKCYRTGGDEFIAFLYTDEKNASDLNTLFIKETEAWQGYLVNNLSVSTGYVAAKGHDDLDIESLIHIADENMYEAKAQFYMQENNDRKEKNHKRQAVEEKKKEYMDIISALSSDITGLYMIDRKKREVTAYRLSQSDHRIRSGVPLQQGFEAAMYKFIDKIVYPDDKEIMRQSIQLDFIERELATKKSFTFHFRSLTNGEIHFHYMKCMRNDENDEFDKIIISFCPEDNLVSRKIIHETINRENRLKEKIVLLAEPEEESRQMIEKNLRQNYKIKIAHNGKEALEILKEYYRDICVILYAENMQGMDGLQFLKAIKDDVFLSSVPVILLNEELQPKKEKKCIEAGAIEFLTKPYDAVILKRRVNHVIHMKEMDDSLYEIEIDNLTGLYTKQAFLYHAKMLIDASKDEDFTIIISDIQNFRKYNRNYGENRGDDLLKLLGDYVRKMVVNGLYARYGADQFIIIVKSFDNKQIPDYVEQMQQYLNKNIAENVILKFGIYENVDKSLDVAHMCDRAIMALKSIKQNYDRTYALFDGAVSQQHFKAQIYEEKFKNAIETREFEVWYQPKYNPYTEKVVGAEALIRWRSDGQMIYPSDFLPVFEANGMISQLDEFVFRTVCDYQRRWREKGKKLIPISVNLSRNSMHQMDIVKRYKAIIEEYGISPSMVPIEITESAAIGTMEIKPLADAFYEEGFSLHMDDFGSGNSSLTGLNVLHFDVVKLDKSLIDFIGDEHGNLVLMYTIALGKELGLHLVAEGVEKKEQLEYLKDNGCEAVQGYYFSKPLPENEFIEKISDNLESREEVYDYRYKLTASDSLVKRAMDRMLQRMPGGFFTYHRDEEERIISSNRFLWNMFGCESEAEFMEHVGGSFKGVVCPEDRESVEAYINQQIDDSSQDMDYVEYRIVRKDGTRIRVADYGHLDHQQDGDIFYVFISKIEQSV